ncbi:MAG: hypothetical protein Ct9H90mP27_7430 [Gammaproteobacteria bacterium]|nr:MAG: hypothetical protein Ct9H90mP27_7430 [Gammaproteobacteria bacterium]
MSEFLGWPILLKFRGCWDIQRAGPFPRGCHGTQQCALISSAYASHGDTKHPFLFPSDPKECFDLVLSR